jgi:hypothetical protein
LRKYKAGKNKMPKITITDDNYSAILDAEIEKHRDLLHRLYENAFKEREKKYKDADDCDLHAPQIQDATTRFKGNSDSFLDTTAKVNTLLKLPATDNAWPLIVILLTTCDAPKKENLLTNRLIWTLKHHKKELLTAINHSNALQALLRYKLNPTFDQKTQCHTYHLHFPLFLTLSLHQHKSHPLTGNSISANYTKPTTNSAKALFHLLGLTTEPITLDNDDILYQIAKSDDSFEDQVDNMLAALPDDEAKLTAVKASVALGQNQQTLGNFMLSTGLLAMLLASLPQQGHSLDKKALLWLSQTACKQQLLFAIEQHPAIFQALIKDKNTLLDVVIDYKKYTSSLFKTNSKTRDKVDAIIQAPPVNQPK